MKLRLLRLFVIGKLLVLGWWLSGYWQHRIVVGARISKSACPSNLRQLEGAKATWALEHHVGTNGVPTETDLIGPDKYIARHLECPEQGVYTLGDMQHPVRCTIARHNLDAGDVFVTDEQGKPVAGAEVNLRNADHYFARTLTDTNGFAHVEAWFRDPTFVEVTKRGAQPATAPLANWPAKLVLKAR